MQVMPKNFNGEVVETFSTTTANSKGQRGDRSDARRVS